MADRPRSPGLVAETRAVVPAVGKTLEIGLVVLFVGLLTTVLLGSVVPGYRTAASAELGERVLATASQEIEAAVPPAAQSVDGQRRVDLPATLRGSGYDLRVDGRWLVLDHPDRLVGGRSRLLLPDHVDSVTGEYHSGSPLVVAVSGDDGGVTVEIREGES